MHADYAIYGVHAVFWGAFSLTRALVSRRGGAAAPPAPSPAAAPTVDRPQTAPYSRALLGLHMVGFAVMYFGLGQAVLGQQVPERFPLQRVAGALTIFAGSAFMCWALLFFRSWRFRAKLEAGHELATGGPFGIVRHPIYLGLNLLAVGTALWVPSRLELLAAVLLLLGSDLRARSEERLLQEGFGDRYRVYMGRTRRFVPGLY